MGLEWVDPTPNNTCDTCKWFRGQVFPDEEAPPLPAHPDCECFYIQNDLAGTAVDWDAVPDYARKNYVYMAAWIIREGERPLPSSLEPLRGDAEKHNKQREEDSEERRDMSEAFRFGAYGILGDGVDRDAHVIRNVVLMEQVEALGWDVQVDEVALHMFVGLSRTQAIGIKSRFTHPGLSSDGLGKFLGRVRDFRVVDGVLVGDLHLSESASLAPGGDLRQYVELRADEDPASFGMSGVFYARTAWPLEDGSEVWVDDVGDRPDSAVTELPVIRPTELRAWDVVDEPAAVRGGLLAANWFGRTTNGTAAGLFAKLDQMVMVNDRLDLVREFIESGVISEPALSDFVEQALDEFGVGRQRARRFGAAYLLSRERHSTATLSAVWPEENPMSLQDEAAVDAARVEEGSDWLTVVSEEGKRALLEASGLPEPVRRRMQAQHFDTPDTLRAAIADRQAELAELSDAGAIDIGDEHPRRPFSAGDLTSPRDRAKQIIDFNFGVEGAQVPAPNLRRFADLYVAMTGDVGFHGVFDEDLIQFSGANTAELAGLAANAMNKVVATQFSAMWSYRWYERVTAVSPNDGSVQNMAWISMGGVGDLPVVAEGQAYTEMIVDDVRENDSFFKRGAYVGITLEMIRNSQIQQLQAIPRALAIASVRTRSARIASIFTQASGVGPTLEQDATALFDASGHGNLLTTAFGTDTTAWRAVRQAIFKQTEINSGRRLGIFPKYALLPVELYDTALSVFGYGEGMPTSYLPEAQDRANDPRPVPIVVPEFTDANDWAAICDPVEFPVIMMSYAQRPGGGSHPMPELYSVASPTAGLNFTNDTMPVKIRDWYAYGVNGYRGIHKNNVS